MRDVHCLFFDANGNGPGAVRLIKREVREDIDSRARFETFAALDAPHLPPDPIDAMQLRLARWEQAQHFHCVSPLPVTLGIGEECGELADAMSDGDSTDALGDVAIYACQLATRHRMAFAAILDTAPTAKPHHGDVWRELLSAVGKVNHLVLKREQRIRIGTASDEVYGEALFNALARLLAAAEDAHADGDSGDSPGADTGARAAFITTAERVLARNWNADAAKGGER